MATVSGFQLNTTIHAAFWIYRPDPVVDPVSKEQFVEVNSLQYAECNAASILANILTVQVASGVMTLGLDTSANCRAGQPIILSGLTNAAFANGEVLTVAAVGPGYARCATPDPDYPQMSEPAGGLVTDAQSRTAWLYYAATDVSTSQAPRKLDGVVAARFVYDMEALFL